MKFKGYIRLLEQYKNIIVNEKWNESLIPTINIARLPESSVLIKNQNNIYYFNFEIDDIQMYNFRSLIELINIKNQYIYKLNGYKYSISIKDNIVEGVVL